MDVLRAVALATHLLGLALLALSLVWAAVAPQSRRAARSMTIGAGLMGLTGLVLIVARLTLGLPVDGAKMAVKTVVLIAVLGCATRLRSMSRRTDGGSGRRAVLHAATAALVVADVVIATAWD